MKKKKPVIGRPKSENPKNKITGVRLTKEDFMKIKKQYGSIQKFLDICIKTLPILCLMIFASCGKDGRDLLPGETIGSGSITYIASSISYSCNGSNCWVSGKIGAEDILSSEFAFTGDLYYNGQICTISGCEDYTLSPALKTLQRI